MDVQDFSAWVGRTETISEQIYAGRIVQQAATLDLENVPATGDPLPPGWQWLYFNPAMRPGGLGADGHAVRGGFLPPVSLPRRMWAGSRITYHAPLPIGSLAEKTSEILKVETKVGKSGTLVFVTVQHSVFSGGALCSVEEQDLVYRDAPAPLAPGAVAAPGKQAPEIAAFSERIDPTPTMLFRYSALTFNGHRIHYDAPYATGEEGYPGLVVHGPLTATLLQGLAVKASGGRSLKSFSFRGLSPLIVDRPFWIEAAQEGEGLSLWARMESGELAMQASATF